MLPFPSYSRACCRRHAWWRTGQAKMGARKPTGARVATVVTQGAKRAQAALIRRPRGQGPKHKPHRQLSRVAPGTAELMPWNGAGEGAGEGTREGAGEGAGEGSGEGGGEAAGNMPGSVPIVRGACQPTCGPGDGPTCTIHRLPKRRVPKRRHGALDVSARWRQQATIHPDRQRRNPCPILTAPARSPYRPPG
jgi:hypothetical protein